MFKALDAKWTTKITGHKKNMESQAQGHAQMVETHAQNHGHLHDTKNHGAPTPPPHKEKKHNQWTDSIHATDKKIMGHKTKKNAPVIRDTKPVKATGQEQQTIGANKAHATRKR